MNVCLIVLGVVLGCPVATTDPPPPPPPPPVAAPAAASAAPADADRWIGEDKLQHMGLSFATAAFAYGAGRTVLDRDAAFAVSAAAALAAGLGKEWLDVRRGRPWSWKDLAWDAAGAAVALIINRNSR